MTDDNRWNERDRNWRDDRFEARDARGYDQNAYGQPGQGPRAYDPRDAGQRGYGSAGYGQAYGRGDYGRYADEGERWREETARRYGAGQGYGAGAYGEGGYGGGAQGRYGYGPSNAYGQAYGRGDYGRADYGYGYGYGAFGSDAQGRQAGQRSWFDKAGDEVSSWFGDREAERRREMDRLRGGEHRGRGPRGYARSDERIREDVSDRLSDDSWLDASSIDVTVADREVTLNGAVNTRDDKRRAEDLAERVSGVSHVQNNLRVSADTGRTQDAYAAARSTTGVTS